MGALFSLPKPYIIGMVHCLALPGTAGFDGDVEKISAQAVADAKTLVRAGIDALIVENMGDGPFAARLDTAQISALAVAAARVKDAVSVPLGIDAAFNDYEAAISIAKALNADFVRIPVFVDTVVYYGGILEPCARQAVLYRKALRAESIKILADIQVKHTHLLVPGVTIEESAKNAAACGADGIIVTGSAIGTETPLDMIERVKKVVKIPVIAGSGVNAENIKAQMAIADGAIIGSSLKEGGVITNPISYQLTLNVLEALGREAK